MASKIDGGSSLEIRWLEEEVIPGSSPTKAKTGEVAGECFKNEKETVFTQESPVRCSSPSPDYSLPSKDDGESYFSE